MRRRVGEAAARWSVLAAAGAPGALAVDAAGRIAVGRVGWSLDWEILAGERSRAPGEAASLRQRAVDVETAAPVALETVVRAAGGDVAQSVYVGLAAGAGGGALGVIDVGNRSSAPVAVTLTLRPGDFWRPDGLWSVEVDDAGAVANGTRALWWPRPPAGARMLADAAAAPGGPHGPPTSGTGWAGGRLRVRSRAGRCGAAFTWPVTHGTALRVLVPLEPDGAAPPEPAVVPTLDQVGRGWDLHMAGGLRLAGLPDGRVETLVAAAIRRLLALDAGPGAGGGPDVPLSPAERALAAAALAVAGYAQRAAEVVSLRAARNPASAARLARREAARVTARFGDAPGAVGAMAADAGPGGGWAGDRGGDDPALRAAFVLAVRDSLVAERDGGLDLLSGTGADLAASRPPIEVHRLVTGHGVLSFAVRWHDRRPALLWELAPPSTRLESWASALAGTGVEQAAAGSAAAPPRLHATALAESWSTRRHAGEELLGA